MNDAYPYRIAVLCYLFDRQGRVLLLRRGRPPNLDLYSPVGGKLEQAIGESPSACAAREIHEETGLSVRSDRLHLTGVVSEAGYENRSHWLMFLYELLGAAEVDRSGCDEGTLSWHEPAAIDGLAIPETDRSVIWPLFWEYRGRFFMAHIDCHDGRIDWRLEQPTEDGARGERQVRRQ